MSRRDARRYFRREPCEARRGHVATICGVPSAAALNSLCTRRSGCSQPGMTTCRMHDPAAAGAPPSTYSRRSQRAVEEADRGEVLPFDEHVPRMDRLPEVDDGVIALV